MEYIVEAQQREKNGRSDARALRRQGRVPGVLYGGDKTVAFSCDVRRLTACLQEEAFQSSVVSVKVDGQTHRALLREVQRHPSRRDVLHIDFQEVRRDREIAAHVPVHFINADLAPGVKLQHGVFTAIENQLSVHCLPDNLPEYIEVDVGALEMGKSIHLSDLTPPAGVRFDDMTRGNDLALATVSGVSEEVLPEAEVTGGADEDAPPAESS